MTEYEAIKMLQEIRHYLTSGNPILDDEEHEFLVLGSPYVGNPIWDEEEVYDAMTMAIVALNNVTDKQNDVVESKNDAINCSEILNGSSKLTNKEWVDFLSKQFAISRTSAKEMLHVMMSVKKNDNLKKQFCGMEEE